MLKLSFVFLFILIILNVSQAKSLAQALEEIGISQSLANDNKNLSVLNNYISERLNKIRKSKAVYSWNVASPRDRTPNYCIDQCACISKAMVEGFKEHYTTRVLTLRPAIGSLEVSLQNIQGTLNSYTYYHMVTLVKVDSKWFVIDPVGTGSAKLERLDLWVQRLENVDSLQARIER